MYVDLNDILNLLIHSHCLLKFQKTSNNCSVILAYNFFCLISYSISSQLFLYMFNLFILLHFSRKSHANIYHFNRVTPRRLHPVTLPHHIRLRCFLFYCTNENVLVFHFVCVFLQKNKFFFSCSDNIGAVAVVVANVVVAAAGAARACVACFVLFASSFSFYLDAFAALWQTSVHLFAKFNVSPFSLWWQIIPLRFLENHQIKKEEEAGEKKKKSGFMV